ncbi:iron-sulfur cluster carrier protein ApbC [Corallincola platygyrae]|uniref:Iron-sulfur cluster carrier protein n=1 Tax=Corallincola platygyrae TaxID=1193278 RepID=A0ABW4XJK1_9GAMM
MSISPELLSSLSTIEEPATGRALGELGASFTLQSGVLTAYLGCFNRDWQGPLTEQIQQAGNLLGIAIDRVEIESSAPKYVESESNGLANVSAIIAVASGKGGVGKSATAANLALALAFDGARVGLVDADIYGPSVPIMLGAEGKTPASDDGKKMNPVQAHGIYCNSLGFIIDSDKAAVWRGPMASGALQQLLNDTIWPELDYLVVDMPPGTGDIQLTLAQKVPVSTALVVTTPQNLALSDARRGVDMFNQVSIPVCGVVENMSYYTCDACGHQNAIFGESGGDALAAETGVPVLGRLPLDPNIRADADAGNPTVIKSPDSDVANRYIAIARKVSAFLWSRFQASQSAVPIIEIE